MTLGLINANPVVHAKKERIARSDDPHADDAVDPLDIYDILFFFSFYLLPHSKTLNMDLDSLHSHSYESVPLDENRKVIR